MVRLVKRACECQACRTAIDAEFRAIVVASFTSEDLDGIVSRTIAEHGAARLYAFLAGDDDGS